VLFLVQVVYWLRRCGCKFPKPNLTIYLVRDGYFHENHGEMKMKYQKKGSFIWPYRPAKGRITRWAN
jgi:hypothetical protein